MQPGAAVDFLEQLSETAPKAYLQRQPSGQSLLRELYAHAAEVGLVPAGAGGDDIARLHALFDVCLDHGMGGLVRDYVAEVWRAAGTRSVGCRWAAGRPVSLAAASNGQAEPRNCPWGLYGPHLASLACPTLTRLFSHHPLTTWQVCSDRLLTSSDPVEAFLLDGECVRRWVQVRCAVACAGRTVGARSALLCVSS